MADLNPSHVVVIFDAGRVRFVMIFTPNTKRTGQILT